MTTTTHIAGPVTGAILRTIVGAVIFAADVFLAFRRPAIEVVQAERKTPAAGPVN